MAGTHKKSETPVSDNWRMVDTMLRALEDMTGQMTDWEKGFLESLSDRFFAEGKDLTPNQTIHLEKLYRKFF